MTPEPTLPAESVLTHVTPEQGGNGLFLRVTRTPLIDPKAMTSEQVRITWDEGRRLLTNLVSLLNYHHSVMEDAARIDGTVSGDA